MKLYTAYRVKIKGYNAILKPTVLLYRKAVSWFLEVILTEWESIQVLSGTRRNNLVEKLTVATGRNPLPKYSFQEADRGFYKMPVYLRRAAIAEALGIVDGRIRQAAHRAAAGALRAGEGAIGQHRLANLVGQIEVRLMEGGGGGGVEREQLEGRLRRVPLGFRRDDEVNARNLPGDIGEMHV